MKKLFQGRNYLVGGMTAFIFLCSIVFSYKSQAQCTATSGTISGTVYDDANNNGSRESGEAAIANALVSIYNVSNQLVTFQSTNNVGEYAFSGLTDGAKYKLTFEYLPKYASSYAGSDNGTDVQFYAAPKCNASLGLVLTQSQCSSNPQIFSTCFVQGPITSNATAATLIGLEYNFGTSSDVHKFAGHGETGSVWGVAWKSTTNELFSSAFVKQYSGMTSHGHGAIYKTTVNGNTGTTAKFTTLPELGINVGYLTSDKTASGTPVAINDCNYGKFVGRAGLGAMVITPAEDFLYVVNLYNKSLVKIPTINPSSSNVEEITIPNPNCSNGEYAPFALKYYNDKIYVGVTCTEETGKSAVNSAATVYEFDPVTKTFTNIFSTNYLKGYWSDVPDDLNTQHWFTDIDFTDSGNMILSFTDRIGHKYCAPLNRLDHQFPDILMAWKDNGVWKLESNGKVGSLTGSGVGNSQGPDGGEFFGDDYWITQPLYHPEIALGSVFVLPGSETVVATTYDPMTNSYSGGLQKYNTSTGAKISAKELYTREATITFGKATGFGDIIGRCGLPSIQVGNLVWLDNNKNGIQDAGEESVSNLTINLLDANCNQIATTTTNANGNYVFSNLIPGAQYYLSLPTSNLDTSYGLIKYNNENYIFSPSVTNNTLTDNNAATGTGSCNNGIISVLSSKTNHTLDIGLVKASGFDLALKNELVGNDFKKKNDLVEFRITVFNQGGIPAKNINISNYIPEGLMYAQADNPSWSLSGNIANTIITSTLLPGSSTSVIIKLRLMSNETSKITDVAEISSATDHNNIPQTDVDSNPDATKGNDTGGQINSVNDNKIDDNGTLDEDDEDPAVPQVLDLALKQTLSAQCINAGDCSTINITLFNQGNVATSSISIVNYFGNLITFGSNNNGWVSENGKLYYTLTTPLNPSESINIPLNICVKEGLINSGVVNYAEIFEVKVNGNTTTKDYDSVPDATADNDAGGTHSTLQDNNVNGNFGIEEDDHDPVYLSVSYLDLALKLTTESSKVQEGDDVCFTVDIYNQGTEILKQVQIVDYIPNALQLNDSDWTLSNGNAFMTIDFPNGFAPGEEHREEICFKVKNLDNIYYIENVAEITGSVNVCDQSTTNKDIDSNADTDKFNDLGGIPLTGSDNIVDALPSFDEDDQDPALLINYTISKGKCTCLANATNYNNGQFGQTITIRGPKGMTWYIDQVVNLYNSTSAAPPAAPTPFITGATGYVLTEVPVDALTSDYVLNGIYEDGAVYSIVFRSADNFYASMLGDGCSYRPVAINGTASLCTSSIETYSVASSIFGYHPSVTGGTITSASADSSSITVQWGAIPGSYQVTFIDKNTSLCSEPGILNVAIGNPHLSMACLSNIQVSLDADCSVAITPSMIVAGPLAVDAPYIVMLTDDKGNTIPNAIINKHHIGKMITAKLIEGCSGNSCWGKIAVEDKTGPTIICNDTVVLSCHKLDIYPGPIASDNCSGIIKLTTLDSTVNQLYCHPKYNQFINKKYIAIDEYGNKSKECKQTLAIKRIEIDSIKFPADIEMANALGCKNYLKDEKGFPSPIQTGVPTIHGDSLYPYSDKACNIAIGYTDRDFGYIGCARKIMRVWTLYENWCNNGTIKKDTQTIIIADIENPSFTCPANVTVSAGNPDCQGLATFPALTNITDDCATSFTVDIKYPGGFINNQNGGSALLPYGSNKITYIVYDQCLNRDSCSMTVLVKDLTPPVVVCEKSTTVGITSLGEGYIYASTVNTGSYDACGIDSMRIRRMDLGAPCNANQSFANLAKFCCADVGKEIMVEMRVWDLEGNANSCMVSVQVQDKTLPKITCPPNVTISCEVDIDPNNLQQYGVATAEDICGATVTGTVNTAINQCRTGYIERIFTASDKNGSVQCTSYIHIERFSTNLNIIWPQDFTTTNGCRPIDLDPSNLQVQYAKPRFNSGVCDLVASSHKDQYFEFDGSGNACFKIIRTWTVIDWCRKDEPGYVPAEYQQLIKVVNNVKPEIEIEADTIVCTLDDSCEEGEISLLAHGDDDCTPTASMSWRYEIDYNYDGTFDPDVYNFGRGGEIDASGTYDIGTHRILFIFEDRCGNQIAQFHDFTIKNCKAPTPSCINGTSISLGQMSINGQLVRMACIPAHSINVSSSHPCGYDLSYSFTSNVNDTLKCFDCTNIGRNSITLYVTDEFGNQSSCVTFIDVQNNDPSIVSITASREIVCPGDSVILTAVGTGTVIWSTGQTTRSIKVNPTTPTTYSVSVTSTDLCTMVASKQIDIFPSPVGLITTNINSNGSSICNGQSITLTASGGVAFKWNTTPVQTTSSITVSPTSTTTYIVTVTNANGCTATASRTITVSPKPTPIIAAASNNICAGASVLLGVNGLPSGTTFTYAWSTTPVSTTATVNVTPTVTTTYTVTVTNANGCSATATSTITVNPLPVISITGPASICAGASATLTATGGGTYLWNIPAPNNTASITVSPTATRTYIVTVTSAAGCTATSSKEVVVNPLPTAAITGPSVTCVGVPVTLTATGGGTYQWNIPAPNNTASITVSPITTTSYTVTVTGTNGCTSTASQTVTVNPLPQASITGPNSVCAGSSITLTAAPAGAQAYNWNTTPPQTTSSITVSPTANTTYAVTVTLATGCSATASLAVTVNPNPSVNITGDTLICVGQSTTLTATGGGTYVWNIPAPNTTAAITVSPAATTVYSVTVTATNGCTNTRSQQVIVSPPNVAVITGNTNICAGESTTLTASGGTQFLWSTGATTSAITVTPSSNTTYTVTVTNAIGCTDTESVTVTVKPLPTFSITGPNTSCAGDPVTLEATGAPAGSTYAWNTTPVQTTASITVSPTTTTTYIVTVTNNGCSASTSKTVTVSPKPVVSITGDLNICVGESTTLTASGGGTYLWSTGATTAGITVSPTTTTTYSVTVTNNGCTNTASATVTVNTNNSPIANCQNIMAFLNASGQVTITGAEVNNNSVPGCDNGTLSFSVTPNTFFCNDVTVPPSGISVVLTVTSSTGPTSTCTATVTVKDTIKPAITCPANLTINCANFTGLSGLPVATATDNCTSPASGTTPAFPNVTVQVLNATNVCNIGTITRTFTATDRAGNTKECSQLITVTPSTDPLTAADIVFPADITLNTCSTLAPSATGSPVVNTQNATCTRIGISFVDVNNNPSCNYTFQRNWRVVDSCQLNPNNPTAGIFTSTQSITVIDNQPPVITGYADITINTAVCPVLVNYNMTNVSITDCSALTITNNAPSPLNANSGNPSGYYSEGTTTVIITAMDQCGFMTKDTINITVVLTTNLEFVVCKKIIRNITDLDFVDVRASEFVDQIQGTCSPQDHKFSYSRTMLSDSVRRFTCDSIGDRLVWVYHYKNGVMIDSCKSIVTILDPSGFCTGNIFRVIGSVNTENFVPVKGVEMNMGDGMPVVITNANGQYTVPDMESQGDYMMQPVKDDGLLEGVTTLDLIMIQRHILGAQKINSAYRMIAADVNNDNKISAADLVELRKAILGITDKFKNNTSWKTIDGRFVFADPSNPFNNAYPLYYEFIQPKGQYIVDFVGVKIGDVNTSYVANANDHKLQNATLTANNEYYEENESVNVHFNISDVNQLDGMQLSFDISGMKHTNVTSTMFNENDMQYHIENNRLYITIAPEVAITTSDEALFTISGTAMKSGFGNELMMIQDEMISNEVYHNLKPIALQQQWVGNTDFEVAQNSPNPWDEKTVISYNIPREGNVKIILTDISGNRILNQNVQAYKGINTFSLSSEVIGNDTGVFFYEIIYEGQSKHGKMLRIK